MNDKGEGGGLQTWLVSFQLGSLADWVYDARNESFLLGEPLAWHAALLR
jgi:hypothetical protein